MVPYTVIRLCKSQHFAVSPKRHTYISFQCYTHQDLFLFLFFIISFHTIFPYDPVLPVAPYAPPPVATTTPPPLLQHLPETPYVLAVQRGCWQGREGWIQLSLPAHQRQALTTGGEVGKEKGEAGVIYHHMTRVRV